MVRLFGLLALALCALPLVLSQATKQYDMPVVLPPFGVKDSDIKPSGAKKEWGTCLLYLEQIGITVFQKDANKNPQAWPAVIGTRNQSNTFGWADDYVNCIQNGTKQEGDKFTPLDFSFKIEVNTKNPVEARTKDKVLFTTQGKFVFTLHFQTVKGYGWRLKDVSTDGFQVTGSGDWLSGTLKVEKGMASNTSVERMDFGTYGFYNYACSGTRVALFPTDNKDIEIGVYFGNIQVQAAGYAHSDDMSKVRFSHYTADCVGTFTAGSFMGIIVALVLASILVFGFLMLNSVQTGDRFDDPKQKQLVINAKD